MDDMTKAAAQGVTTLFGISPIVTILVLVILAQAWVIRWFMITYREDNKLNRDVISQNNTVLGGWQQIVNNAINK